MNYIKQASKKIVKSVINNIDEFQTSNIVAQPEAAGLKACNVILSNINLFKNTIVLVKTISLIV